MRFIFFILVLSSYLFSLDFYINSKTTANAKTLYMEFDKQKDINYKNITIDKRVYKIFSHPYNKAKMYALIPISYYREPEEIKAQIIYEDNKIIKKEFLKLIVEEALYKKERIKVQPSKVNPHSKNIKKRTAKEYKEAIEIYDTFSEKLYIKKPFIVPMNSKITSDFGKARVYNDELEGYHSGTDFRAKIGTKIIASNA
jgi:murein DD-endopeptidase MepM/ murein hydrolase activator NlpD